MRAAPAGRDGRICNCAGHALCAMSFAMATGSQMGCHAVGQKKKETVDVEHTTEHHTTIDCDPVASRCGQEPVVTSLNMSVKCNSIVLMKQTSWGRNSDCTRLFHTSRAAVTCRGASVQLLLLQHILCDAQNKA
ncbi:hypothetical protein JOB18_033169, partial [Solea senegalensis]